MEINEPLQNNTIGSSISPLYIGKKRKEMRTLRIQSQTSHTKAGAPTNQAGGCYLFYLTVSELCV